MRKYWWLYGSIALLLATGLTLGGCSLQLKWFGAGGVDCEWDEMDYKQHEREQQEAGDFRSQVERSMRHAEEEQKQLEFGACTGDDLVNRTCH